MSCMLDMTPTSLAVAIASRTVKIIKNGLRVLKEEKILYGMVYFAFKLSQSSEIVFRS